MDQHHRLARAPAWRQFYLRRVQHLKTFVDEGTARQIDTMLLDDGAALVVWLETTDRGAEVRARRVRPDGEASVSAIFAVTDVSRASGFPRMRALGNDVILAWTDTGPDGSVRAVVATLPID